jgi:hypothetical protein
MLLTQHPIKWIDWTHEWDTEECTLDISETNPAMTGQGTARRNGQFNTLGMLWDIIEARLLRGCALQAFMYPNGCSFLGDFAVPESAKTMNRYLTRRLPDGGRTYANSHHAYMSRIGMRAFHHWSVIPLFFQLFDGRASCWRVEGSPLPTHSTVEDCRISRTNEGDGTYWLNEDCKRDTEEVNRRWSRSEAPGDSTMTITGIGGGSHDHLYKLMRLQRRELGRQEFYARPGSPPAPPLGARP